MAKRVVDHLESIEIDAVHCHVAAIQRASLKVTAGFEEEVATILARSQANNARDDITGALLFNEGCFAQVLEGPLDRVETAFERIQQDERHGDVFLLALEPIMERSFPNWAMGFIGQSGEMASRFSQVGPASGFDISRLTGAEVHAVLRDLAVDEEFASR